MEEDDFNISSILDCLHTGNMVLNCTSSTINLSNNSNITNSHINVTANNSGLTQFRIILVAEVNLSILCSALLILIYWIIGENKTLPGKITIQISFCFIIAYVFLMMDYIFRSTIPQYTCFLTGVICHGFFMASFFWTNVLSYDIMRTVRAVTPNRNSNRQFRKYFAYACGMTLLCVVAAVIVDLSDTVSAYYKPKFGVKRCWLNGGMAFFLYFNGPVGITLLANCVFFVLTARNITQVQNATSNLVSNRQRERYKLCVKLVLVMGLVWIPEFLPWLTYVDWLLTLAEALFCLHGVYMFIIFVCKRRTLKKLAGLMYPTSSTKPTQSITSS